MTHRERWLTAGVVVLAICVVMLMLRPAPQPSRHRETPPALAEVDRSSETTTAHAAPETATRADKPVAAVASRMFSQRMPDRTQPLAAQLAALRSRAEEGDPVAACSLALDVLLCAAAAEAEEFVSRLERSVSRRQNAFGDDMSVDMLAQSRERLVDPETYCAGVDPEQLPSPDMAVSNALQAMSVRQKVLLTLATHDGQIVRFPRRVLPLGKLGRGEEYVMPQYVGDHGYEFLLQGVELGDPLALEGLVLVHLPVWNPAFRWEPGLSRPNPRLFVTYTLMLRELIGAEALGDIADTVLWRVRATMSQQELSRIDADVQQRLARWRRVPAHDAVSDGDIDPRTACGT